MHLDSKGCCKNPWTHAEGHLSYYNFLKSPIFNSQRLDLHENGVKFHQRIIGAIRASLTQTYNIVWCYARFPDWTSHRAHILIHKSVLFTESQDFWRKVKTFLKSHYLWKSLYFQHSVESIDFLKVCTFRKSSTF